MALQLNGVNQSGVITGYKGIAGAANRSVSLWFKTTATATINFIVWGSNAALATWQLFQFEWLGTFYIQLGITGGNRVWDCTGLNDGVWHHAVWVMDGTKTSDVDLYIDKNLMPQSSINDQILNTGAVFDVTLGKYPAGAGFYDGDLFDIRIYSTNLTVGQITTIYDAAGCDSETGSLETRHEFWTEAGICVTEADTSGNGRTLDTVNNPSYVPDIFAPCPTPPAIEETDLVVRRPRVLILNSGIDIFDLGYVSKIGKIQEKKTFQRDKVITNQMTIPVHNIDDQFNPDNPNSIFAGINWRYQPCRAYDEDDNKIWDGIIDDFKDDQNGKKTGLVTKDSLLNFFKTHIEYESADWETPGNAFKNICDDYGYTNYNTKYLEDSIAQYNDNNCSIKCNFNLSDNITFQQAIEKIAKYGAADCYSAGNMLNFKLSIPFTGGVKFYLEESDLRKNIKSRLSRVSYNNYIINYFGDAGVAAIDEDNNNIGEVSRDRNGPQDIVLDGSDNQQIIIKDLASAVFLGEQHIRRTHVNLSTVPFPPLIIDFSLSYDHKDYINLQTWFRMSNTAKGWTNKLFEVYINNIDHTGRFLDLTAYEVNE